MSIVLCVTVFVLFIFGGKIERFSEVLTVSGSGSPTLVKVFQTPDGGFLGVGEYMKNSATWYDIVALKFTSEGVLEWSSITGGEETEHVYDAVHLSGGNYVICGSTKSVGPGVEENAFIAKYDETDGSVIWFRTVGSVAEDELCRGVIEDGDGNIVFVGTGSGTVKNFMVKLSPDGIVIWDFNTDTESISHICNFENDGVRGYIVGGSSAVLAVNITGDILWHIEYTTPFLFSISDVLESQDQQFIYAAGTDMGSGGPHTAMMKIHPNNGTVVWAKRMTRKQDYGTFFTQTSDGNYFIHGSGSNTTAGWLGFVIKLDPEMNVIYVNEYFDLLEITANGIYVDDVLKVENEEAYIISGHEQVSQYTTFSKVDAATGLIDGCKFWKNYEDYDVSEFSMTVDVKVTPVVSDLTLSISTVTSSIQVYTDTIDVQSGCVSCENNFYGDDCDVTECNNVFSNETDLVCNYGNGDCSGYEKCNCDENYYGLYCDVTTCNDVFSNVSTTAGCNEHGDCDDFDDCKCDDYYYGQFCDVYECAGFLSNETACNGGGTCTEVGGERCICEDYYYGQFCEVYECAGFMNNETMCNEHGTCTVAGNSVCSCFNGYTGDFCEIEVSTDDDDDVDSGIILNFTYFLLFFGFFW